VGFFDADRLAGKDLAGVLRRPHPSRYLFRVSFLHRQYADMMRATLRGTDRDAQQRAAGSN
jgi:hypothetical protein